MKETPKYQVVADHIRQLIMEQQYTENQRLPQELVLAKTYNVSRITVRNALNLLVNEGLIFRIQGSGTYVKDNHPDATPTYKASLDLFDFEQVSAVLLNFAVDKPESSIVKRLKMSPYDFAYEIEREIKKDDQIVAIQRLYMPAKIIQGIQMAALKSSIYQFLQSDLGLELGSAVRTISSRIADETLVKKMRLTEKEALITVEQRSFLKNGKIFEYVSTDIRSTQFTLHDTIDLT